MLNYTEETLEVPFPVFSEETMRRVIEALNELHYETGCVYRTIFTPVREWELQSAERVDLENSWEYGTIFKSQTLEEVLAHVNELLAKYDTTFTQGAE